MCSVISYQKQQKGTNLFFFFWFKLLDFYAIKLKSVIFKNVVRSQELDWMVSKNFSKSRVWAVLCCAVLRLGLGNSSPGASWCVGSITCCMDATRAAHVSHRLGCHAAGSWRGNIGVPREVYFPVSLTAPMLDLVGMEPVQLQSCRADAACGESSLPGNVWLHAFAWILHLLKNYFNFCLPVFRMFFLLQIFHLNARAEASKNVRNKMVLVCDNKAKLRCHFTSEIPERSDVFMGVMTSLQTCCTDLGWCPPRHHWIFRWNLVELMQQYGLSSLQLMGDGAEGRGTPHVNT